MKNIKQNGRVLRDTARAPQPPTNRAPNEPAGPIRAQKAMFWGKMAVLGPNFLIIYGGSNSSSKPIINDATARMKNWTNVTTRFYCIVYRMYEMSLKYSVSIGYLLLVPKY